MRAKDLYCYDIPRLGGPDIGFEDLFYDRRWGESLCDCVGSSISHLAFYNAKSNAFHLLESDLREAITKKANSPPA